MVLQDDLEVDVLHSKRPFEEQERELFFRQQDYETTSGAVAGRLV